LPVNSLDNYLPLRPPRTLSARDTIVFSSDGWYSLARAIAAWSCSLTNPETVARAMSTARGASSTIATDAGVPDGYAAYRIKATWDADNLPASQVRILELMADSSQAYEALWHFCLNIDLVTGPLTPAQYTGAIAATLGVPLGTAALLGSFYPLAGYPSPDLALSALGTDAIFACNSRKAARLLSQFVPTHAYEFNDEDAPQLFLPPVSFPYGSAHASEIQYLFNLRSQVPHPDLTSAQQQLSRAMVAYWANFARTGDPNWLGTPFWPAYDRTGDRMQSLAPPTPAVESGFAADHKCAVWAPTP